MKLTFLTDHLFAENKRLSHGFFTRKGGASKGLYSSLNCGFGSQDKRENIAENRRRVEKSLGAMMLATVHQCHSAKVATITNPMILPHDETADALVTNQTDIALGILTADCAPVLFADTQNGVIGAAHAGWKGALKGIVSNTVTAMVAIGADKSQIHACIGPAITQDSYQVDSLFRAKFAAESSDYKKFFERDVASASHYRFDLKGFVALTCEKAGLTSIETLPNNTYTEEESFFSYRRSCHNNEPDYGRHISCISVKET